MSKGKWWIGNDDRDPLEFTENDAPRCECDLQYEAPKWWANTPGLHHLEGCPMRVTTPESNLRGDDDVTHPG